MGWSFGHPAAEEPPDIFPETSVRVCVTSRRNRMALRLTLSHDELELAGSRLADREHGDGPHFDLKLYRSPHTRFAVILFEATQNGLSVGDVDMVRAVMANEHRFAGEVNRMELCETAAQ